MFIHSIQEMSQEYPFTPLALNSMFHAKWEFFLIFNTYYNEGEFVK